MSEEKPDEKKPDYVIDPSKPFLEDLPKPRAKVSISVDPEKYLELKEKYEDLKATLDAVAISKFEDEKEKLLRIADPQDKETISSIESPDQLTYWQGRLSHKLEKSYLPPETSGQASMREFGGLRNMVFDNPKEMGQLLLAKSTENTPEGKEAREMLAELRRKFGDRLYEFDKTTKFQVPYTANIPDLSRRGGRFPIIKGKNEKSEASSFTKPIVKGER